AADAEPQLYVGGAANTVDVLGYLSFLSRCAADDRFTADHLIPAMASKVRMTWLDKVTYRFVLIPFVRKRLLEQGEGLAWAKRRTARGRSANFRAMWPSRSPASGSRGPISTTARFRPYATFSSRRRRGRPRSFAASMWWMHVTAVSSPRLAIRASNRRKASA